VVDRLVVTARLKRALLDHLASQSPSATTKALLVPLVEVRIRSARARVLLSDMFTSQVLMSGSFVREWLKSVPDLNDVASTIMALPMHAVVWIVCQLWAAEPSGAFCACGPSV
jgi:hypothetical protein